jgi:hypothetical protein
MAARSFCDQLVEAGLVAGTDKISIHHYESSYARCLERFLSEAEFAMVEIGYGSGAGIQFWKSVFPNAFIYCFDRDHEDEGDRFKVLKVDQSGLESLQCALTQVEHPISVIIDDGSHHPAHQLLTFCCLFQSLLKAGGIYIIEDIETSYWRSGYLYGYLFNYGLGDPWSVMEAFKVACDYVNRRFLCNEDKSFLQYRMMSIGLDPAILDAVESIQFHRNLIAIAKADKVVVDNEPYGNAAAAERF